MTWLEREVDKFLESLEDDELIGMVETGTLMDRFLDELVSGIDKEVVNYLAIDQLNDMKDDVKDDRSLNEEDRSIRTQIIDDCINSLK